MPLAGAVLLAACGESPPPAGPTPEAPSEAQAFLDTRLAQARLELDREFVVFAIPAMVIDQLGIPVPPPVTVGSRPGPRTMTSDDPDMLSIGPDGSLVAHREGATRVRAVGSGSALSVVVRAQAPSRSALAPKKGVSP
jgi:hypothetical protein